VRVEYVRQRPDVHRRNTFVIETFYEGAGERVLGVVTSPGASVVQASDTVATVSTFLQRRLEPGDFSRGFAEPFEQVASFVQVLLAGGG
jgi:hypothetical protein